jgi:hypothetical protein
LGFVRDGKGPEPTKPLVEQNGAALPLRKVECPLFDFDQPGMAEQVQLKSGVSAG